MKVDQVFGISPQVRDYSYVDRGNLDNHLSKLLKRTTHIALRGPSKCGKSWLRQKVVTDPITVQCRHKKTFSDLYVDALSQLGIRIKVQEHREGIFKAEVSATTDSGFKILEKIGLSGKASASGSHISTGIYNTVGHNVDDLRFVADVIKKSERRLVIEDFHYMSVEDRKHFSFDLKTLWDYEVFVVIIGVWSENNLLLHLNPDLTGRVQEISIEWTNNDLERILSIGSKHLGIEISQAVKNKLVSLSYSNAGLLQQLILTTLDEAGIDEVGFARNSYPITVDHVDTASMLYAEQLNPVYSQFSKRVASGVRTRRNATGIYAHAMAVIMSATDEELIRGLHAREIFSRAVIRQERIQYGNLKSILDQLEGLQVDTEGRGLIIAYSRASEEVTIVDRQLLLYRKFATVKWPWEELISEADDSGGLVGPE